MKAQKCPVCEGKGVVPAEFYPDTKDSTEKWVTCRTCNGVGIVQVQEEVEAVVSILEEKLKDLEKKIEKPVASEEEKEAAPSISGTTLPEQEKEEIEEEVKETEEEE